MWHRWLILVALSVAPAVFAADRYEMDVSDIYKSHADFIRAFNAGDLDGAFGFLTDDFVALVEKQPTMDKAAYRALVTPFVATNKTDFRFDLDETVVAGDWAFERIRYSVSPRAGGETQHVSWRALGIWRREPTGWKVARYIRTPDPPPTKE